MIRYRFVYPFPKITSRDPSFQISAIKFWLSRYTMRHSDTWVVRRHVRWGWLCRIHRQPASAIFIVWVNFLSSGLKEGNRERGQVFGSGILDITVSIGEWSGLPFTTDPLLALPLSAGISFTGSVSILFSADIRFVCCRTAWSDSCTTFRCADKRDCSKIDICRLISTSDFACLPGKIRTD